MQGAAQHMGHLPPNFPEQSKTHDLQTVLCTMRSLLEDLAPDFRQDKSLLNLDMALRAAIAELELGLPYPPVPARIGHRADWP
jgi:hypothetical protein